MTVAVLSALLLVTACAGAQEVGETGNTGSKVTIGLQPTATSFPIWLAEQKGYFQENGIEVELKYYPSGAAMSEAGLTGAWDGGNMGSPPALTSSQKWDMVVPGPNSEEGAIQILWGRTNDFKGKDPATVLGGGEVLVKVNSTQHYAFLGCMQKYGVAGETKPLPVEANAVAGAFTGGQGVGAMTWPPFDAEFVDNPEYVHVCDGKQAGKKIFNMLALTPAFANNRTEQAVAYVKSAYQANEFITANPDEAADLLVQYYKENGVTATKEAAQRELTGRTWPSAAEALALSKGELSSDLEDLTKVFVDLGAFDTEPDVTKAVDTGREILEQAVGESAS
ncbi:MULTISPECIES: ABC transporter substrate-binding protein [Prauserella]|nr:MULTISPECIES: ABC transporter substrate-binding protein [Prauserella]